MASVDNNQAYKLGKVSNVFSGDNFTRVRVSTDKLEVAVYERKGELVQEIQFPL